MMRQQRKHGFIAPKKAKKNALLADGSVLETTCPVSGAGSNGRCDTIKAHDLRGRNHVIPDRISRDVLRRKRSRDYFVLPRQNPAALSMRLAPGMP